MKLKHFAELSRIEHAIMVVLAVLIGEFLVLNFNVPVIPTILACLSASFTTIGAFIYSDYQDIETDILNKRKDRPLARGDVHPKEAWVASWIFFGLGLVFAYFVNANVFAISVFFTAVSILYAYSLKKVPLLGNTLIALSMNIPFVYGNLVVSNFVQAPVLLLAFSSFLFGIGREVIKSIEDMYGDKKTGRLTFPMVTGIKKSEWFASITIFMAMAVQIYMFLKTPPFMGAYHFIIPVLIGDFFVAYGLHELIINRTSNYRQIRNLTLIAPFLVMLGIFLVLLF